MKCSGSGRSPDRKPVFGDAKCRPCPVCGQRVQVFIRIMDWRTVDDLYLADHDAPGTADEFTTIAARPQDIFCVARAKDGRVLFSCPGGWHRDVTTGDEAVEWLGGWFRSQVNAAIRATPGWTEADIHTVQLIWTRPDGETVGPSDG